MVKLVLFVLPLGLDTFAVSAALGVAGLPKQQRLKISLLPPDFEMAMPVIGLLIGHALGHAIDGRGLRGLGCASGARYLDAGLVVRLGDQERRRGRPRLPTATRHPPTHPARPITGHQRSYGGDLRGYLGGGKEPMCRALGFLPGP